MVNNLEQFISEYIKFKVYNFSPGINFISGFQLHILGLLSHHNILKLTINPS